MDKILAILTALVKSKRVKWAVASVVAAVILTLVPADLIQSFGLTEEKIVAIVVPAINFLGGVVTKTQDENKNGS